MPRSNYQWINPPRNIVFGSAVMRNCPFCEGPSFVNVAARPCTYVQDTFSKRGACLLPLIFKRADGNGGCRMGPHSNVEKVQISPGWNSIEDDRRAGALWKIAGSQERCLTRLFTLPGSNCPGMYLTFFSVGKAERTDRCKGDCWWQVIGTSQFSYVASNAASLLIGRSQLIRYAQFQLWFSRKKELLWDYYCCPLKSFDFCVDCLPRRPHWTPRAPEECWGQ